MKEITITMFEAIDGHRFDNPNDAIERDASILDKLLASLPREVIRESLKRVGLIVRTDRSPGPPNAKEAEAA